MKKLRTFAVSMIIAAIGLLIYCAGFYIKSYEQNLAARQEYAELSQMAGVKNREGAGLLADSKKTDEDSSTKNSEKKSRKKQRRSSESKNKNCTDEIRESFGIFWENLRKINSQTVAWITVPGADISYPVVQAADDEYYLKHNFRGEEDLFGCIFLEHDIKKNFTDSHSILYGHNIEGNMMFANNVLKLRSQHQKESFCTKFFLWNRHLPKARHLNMDTSYPVLHTGDNYLY